MKINLLCRFATLDFYVKLIWVFCVLGALLNAILLVRDLSGNSVLLRLHIGFFVLYVGQITFILLKERMVFILSLLQAVLAFMTNADFTFVPIVRSVARALFLFTGEWSVDSIEVYKYVFISLCFTLELLKTYLLFSLLGPTKKQKSVSSALSER